MVALGDLATGETANVDCQSADAVVIYLTSDGAGSLRVLGTHNNYILNYRLSQDALPAGDFVKRIGFPIPGFLQIKAVGAAMTDIYVEVIRSIKK